MKKTKLLGIIAIVLALVVLCAGIVGSGLDKNGGALGEKFAAAQETHAQILAHGKAAEKTAPSAAKKAAAAQSAAQSAEEKAQQAYDDMIALDESIANDGTTGDATLDAIRTAAAQEEGSGQIGELGDEMLLAMYQQFAEDAQDALNSAEEKAITAQSGIGDVWTAVGKAGMSDEITLTEFAPCTTIEECKERALECVERAKALGVSSQSLIDEAAAAQEEALAVVASDHIDIVSSFLVFAQANWLGFVFTAALLLIVAIVLLTCAEQFMRAWKNIPVFSTVIAVLVMAVIQTYALGFNFETPGEWLIYWFNNAMNVLRANSSIGMIALGMTFVIISGGIDLAVGSTLAGVSTVIMCLIDVGQGGFLTNMGITGIPAYLIACTAGIIVGVLLGGATGGLITKGNIPPFIVTLGMMQIIRSVAQYFTKSYTPDVPKEFQVIANSVVGGQMLLPIIYWLVLAVIFHIISRHTAFGRHVYAVGSNERTTRLSGINVDKVKMKVYLLMGFVVALASIVQVARLRGVDVASAGSGYEMNAIAAVVVGGTSMAGGTGSIIGTVLGVLIIGIMNNLLVLLRVDSFLSSAFTGAIVIAAVLMQRKQKNA